MQTEKQRERLVEIAKGFFRYEKCSGKEDSKYCKECENGGKLADYLMSNNVVVLPCAVGDTAYYVFDVFEEVCKGRIVEIRINLFTEPKIWISVEYDSKFIGRQVCNGNEMLGKTVFLSREEAEAKLRERRDGT